MSILPFLAQLDWNRLIHGLALTLAGFVGGMVLGYWRRRRQRRQMKRGDIRHLLTIEKMLIKEQPDGTTTLRLRSLGSAPLNTVLTNEFAYTTFFQRLNATSASHTLIDMQDKDGSYLLQLLQPWVCMMAQVGPFPHDVWVMAPICERGQFGDFQQSTIILIRHTDLLKFLDWEWCKRLHVEHGSDGTRVLSLWQMAKEFERQMKELIRLKVDNKSTKYVETMYLLDLALDVEECPLFTRSIPWERYRSLLDVHGLSA